MQQRLNNQSKLQAIKGLLDGSLSINDLRPGTTHFACTDGKDNYIINGEVLNKDQFDVWKQKNVGANDELILWVETKADPNEIAAMEKRERKRAKKKVKEPHKKPLQKLFDKITKPKVTPEPVKEPLLESPEQRSSGLLSEYGMTWQLSHKDRFTSPV